MNDFARAFSTTTFLLGFCVLSADAQTEIERLVPAAPDGSVEITSISGSAIILGWDRNEIEIRGTLGRGVEELAVEQRGNRTEIQVVVKHRGRYNSQADLEIKVPRRSSIDLETVSAEMTVTEVEGEMDIETISGMAHIEGNPRTLKLESVSGSLDVRGEIAEVDIETVSGNVILNGSFRQLEVSAVSGRIAVETDVIRHGDLEGVSGEIKLRGDLAAGGSLEVSTHSGSVILSLPSTISAEFDVSTYSGQIDNDFGPEARQIDRYNPAKELRFSHGGDAGRIEIDSFSGNVELRRR